MTIQVKRKNIRFYPNSKRIITRFFPFGDDERKKTTIAKVLSLSDSDVEVILKRVLIDYSRNHRNISKVLMDHYNKVKDTVTQLDVDAEDLSRERKLLIGSYFTKEFSIESSAFFNPSIVEDPDQTGLDEGEKRVIVTFRATGEGHISSIVFRSGVIDRDINLTFKSPGTLLDIPEEVQMHMYEKESFIEKLSEMEVNQNLINLVMERLDNLFMYEQLRSSITATIQREDLDAGQKKVIEEFIWLAESYYSIRFSPETALSERVIFPVSASESNGIEDSRFVKFIDDDGDTTYYATYTAYNGITILPKLMETKDFCHFKVMPLHGKFARNKGLALFPKKINNKYAMVGRADGVNNYIMLSDDIHYWQEAHLFQEPEYPWQFVQIGNCGSPIETEKGWILLTHGVGPMRKYCLGLTLLDLNDPTKVLGQTREPLLAPNEDEREGYVPNVVYTCGAMIHNNELLIPYGVADYSTSFATVSLDELFAKLQYT